MESTSGQSRDTNRVVYFLSPRSGGPYKQHALLAKTLHEHGYTTYHVSGLFHWIRLHFNRTDIIVSGIPFLWIPNRDRFILNVRGDYREEFSLRNPLALLYPYGIYCSKHIVVPSDFLKIQLKLTCAHVIPNAIEKLPNYTPVRESIHPLKIGTSMSFDFLQKAEGSITIMYAIQKLDSIESLEFHIYGDGTYLEKIREFTQKHKKDFKYKIVFHGHQKDIVSKLASLDIFVYWSVLDNMPNAILDALACGLPIVANRHGAFGEILGDDNMIATNPDEFTHYIDQLIKSQLKRKQFGAKNWERSHQFHISNIIEKWIQVLPK